MRAWSTQRWRLWLGCTVLAADVALCFVLLLQAHGWTWGPAFGSPSAFLSSLRDFSADTVDLWLLGLVRPALWSLLLVVGLRVGSPAWALRQEKYEQAMRERKEKERA